MKLTPKEIDNSKPCYSIPIYQRLFEWDNENVGILLDDLWHAYVEGTNNYYIGMLTTTSKNELVDGQQRFVVMMLLGCVLKEYYSEWVKFIFIKVNDTSYELRLKFPSRLDDEAHLKHLVSLKLPDETDKTKMGEAVKGIYNFLKGKTDAQKKGFSEYVFNHLSFFISKLPEGYDAVDLNKYFERMNTQGKNLEPHEILKVKLLRHFGDNSPFYMQLWNRLSDVDRPFIEKRENEKEEDFYDRKKRILLDVLNGKLINSENLKKEIGEKEGNSNRPIKEIEPSIYKPESSPRYSSGSRSPLSFPQLLLQTLYYLIGGNIEVPLKEFFETKNLNETFDNHLLSKESNEKEEDLLKKFLKTLVKCRLALDFCFIRPTDGGYSLDMDLSTKGSEDEEKKKLLMFESMLYVSDPPLPTRKTNYNWFLWLMEFVEDPGRENFTAQELLDHFTAQGLLKHFKLKDNERHANRVPPEGDLSYGKGKVDRYWFWRLDYYLWENREEFFKGDALRVAENYIFRYNRSIEHVAPQYLKQKSSLQWKEDNEDDKKIRHSFGNLAMISSGLNSSLSNASFEVKQGHVMSYLNGSYRGSIESLKLLWIFTKYATWDRDKIKDHQEDMLKILENSFELSSDS